MKKSKLSLALLLFSFSLEIFAADLAGISRIFKTTFWTSHYQEGYCGKNIEKLVELSLNKRLDLSGAYILLIKNPGGTFGMVNAFEARERGRLIVPARTAPARSPGDMNWFHHVVLYVDGKVLDYDFGNEARVTDIKEYLKRMFVPKARPELISRLKGYEVQAYPAEDYILRKIQRLSVEEIKTQHTFKDFVPDLY